MASTYMCTMRNDKLNISHVGISAFRAVIIAILIRALAIDGVDTTSSEPFSTLYVSSSVL